ncbi:gem-associated protein 4-like [Amphiura filiformis]|uniref:gem-associated protein 4-like n=1 Tax=Amphiura filiformis TaxID=82378 RepID=UPI003B21E9B9
MEGSCNLLQELCIIVTENDILSCKQEEKLHLLNQLLDLLLELGEVVDINTKQINDEEVEGLRLERSRLYAACAATNWISGEDPGRIEFSSEALYCRRLLDVTPTDERLLSNPRRILQMTDEIDNIQLQSWLCLSQEPLMFCSCMGNHMLSIVKVVCWHLWHETWRDILNGIVDIHEPSGVKDAAEATHQPTNLGIKLYHTFSKIKVCVSQMSNPQSNEDHTYVLQSLNQSLDMLPAWLQKPEHKNIVTKSKVDLRKLNSFVRGLCKKLEDDSIEVDNAYSETSLVRTREDRIREDRTKEDRTREDRTRADRTREDKKCLNELVMRVNERLHEYEESLVQMLTQQHHWGEEEWIVGLEENSSALCDQRVCKLLYDAAIIMKDKQSGTDTLNRLLKVFLCSFASLPPLLQNQMCEDIWSHPTGHTLFSTYLEQTNNFHQEMTSAFNRLVNIATKEGLDEAIGRVAMVALQSPSDTLYTAVNRAVANSAALQSVLKVLQMLSSLGRFKVPGDSKPLLVQILRDVIDSCNDMSSNEETNLTDLVAEILQPYRLSSSCPYQDQPLMSHSLLVETCIMPYLHRGITDASSHDNQTQYSRLGVCVKLINTSLTRFEVQTSPLNTEWIPGMSQFPIILCLCDILDQSFALWDSNSCLTSDCKELVGDVLLRITNALELSHEKDETFVAGLQWLTNRTGHLHWTTQLQLQISLQRCRHDNKKVVPACLLHLCDLPSDAWTVLPDSESEASSLSEQLLTFFQCCRISDQLQSQLHQALKSKADVTKHKFYQATLVAMVTVLPQSTVREIERIARMLKLQISEGVLKVPISSQFVTSLPAINLTDYKVALCMCQLLASFVTVLASECCQDWVSMPLWGHTIKAVVMCLKDIASDIQSLPSEPTNSQEDTVTSGSFFTLTQILCHTCHMITLVPSDVTDQLFVLTLDLLGRIEEWLPSNTKEDKFEWNSQRGAVETLINYFENREQKQTLMQKIASLH